VASPAPGEATLDLDGLARLFGDPRAMAMELRRMAADRGLQVRVAIAGSRTAARLLARHRPGVTVVAPGDETRVLATLPIDTLLALVAGDADAAAAATRVRTLQRWGLRTLGDFVQLPAGDVAVRLGQPGVRLQRLARGEDLDPLVPDTVEERFEQAFDLEWPIEGLEPLSFVLGRLLDPLAVQLERRDRGAAVVHVHLHLVTRDVHRRSLQLPVPIRDARALRTLLLLDLESHPPMAAIDRIVVSIDPTPGRVVQYSLLTRPLPTPEQLSTLMARLQALMGESRCGAPAVVDTWAPGAFTMAPFAPRDGSASASSTLRRTDPALRPDAALKPEPCGLSPDPAPGPEPCGLWPDPALRPEACGLSPSAVVALRRFRVPIVARVQVEDGRPVRVLVDRRGCAGGRVVVCAGPWRTSGEWWTGDSPRRSTALQVGSARRPPGGWDRDEWDVTIAGGTIYRVFRDRESGTWFVDGVID
jgi:protein ImuB